VKDEEKRRKKDVKELEIMQVLKNKEIRLNYLNIPQKKKKKLLKVSKWPRRLSYFH